MDFAQVKERVIQKKNAKKRYTSMDFAQVKEPRHSEKKIAKKKVYLYGFCSS